ncbi:MAG: DinB family protein [Dehalococcoidia bacterium]|nr:DinB family protein [Dehalococcoidia bacterium]
MNDDELAQALSALDQAVRRVETAARQVPAGAWDDIIHTGDGAWTRRQLLAHLASSDRRQLVRIRIGAGIPEPGDEQEHAAELQIDTWNQARVDERSGQSIDDLLTEMRANRGNLVALLGRLSPEQRERPMPFRGVPTPLPEMIRFLILHFDMHAAELTR